MKRFNTTAVCIPSKHYMVDISDKVADIRKMVDAGFYFTINRARQYGKTTTLAELKKVLSDDYYAVSMDFQDFGNETYESEDTFCRDFLIDFCARLWEAADNDGLRVAIRGLTDLAEDEAKKLRLFTAFMELRKIWELSDKPIVLMIDEADSATNNQVFLDFLAQLRSHYIKRSEDNSYKTFQSVILAGVTDVKHLKSKIRPDEEHKVNSPWNIAADFMIDMSLSEEGIRGMLDEYEADYNTGMDTRFIAQKIRAYTNGYPFLVSRICQLLDERLVPEQFATLSDAWTDEGVEEAVKALLAESNTLFDSLMGKIRNSDELRNELRMILFKGEDVPFFQYNNEQEQLIMFGFLVNDNKRIAFSNRIFEMLLYNYYIGESRFAGELRGGALDNKPEFIKGGELDIPLIMDRFIRTQAHIRNLNDEDAEKRFIEDEGREKFLTYLSPIINGVGTFSVEDRNRDRKRMDVVIHYMGKRYIIELKIWHGDRYNEKGEKQILEYLDTYGLSTGYMLSFNFNKSKTPGIERVEIGGKVLFEAAV